MNAERLHSLGFNGQSLHASTKHLDLQLGHLIGSPTHLKCPYDALPVIAQKAFLELKRNKGAPDSVIFAWLLTAMAAAGMRVARVKPPGRDTDVLSLVCITAAEPGTGKSPVYERIMPPFRDFDLANAAKRNQVADDYESKFASWTAIKKGLSSSLTKLTMSTKPEDAEKAKEVDTRLAAHMRCKPTKPVPHRMLKTSASLIRILKALSGDSEPLLLSTDEGAKLLNDIINVDPEFFNQIIDGSTIIVATSPLF